MRKMQKYLLTVTVVFCLVAYAPPGTKIKFIDGANMDLAVKPGDNFYLYVNGNWIKNNPVPASKTRWGSFDVLREQICQIIGGADDVGREIRSDLSHTPGETDEEGTSTTSRTVPLSSEC